ncbi:hypothetical protein Tco_1205385 [Tanacetum coccineum]
MTTPRTPVTSHARIFIPFIILPDSKDEDTTLPVVYALLSSDYVPASPDYSLNSDSDYENRVDSPMAMPIGSSHQEIVALRARVETLEQQDRVTRDSLRIARGRITRLQLRAVAAEQQATDLQDSQVTDRLEIIELCSRVEYAETRLEQRHIRQNGDRVGLQRAEMTEQDVEVVDAWAEAAEQQAEALQISLGATQIDITDLLESRRDDRLEMAEL